MRSAVFNLKSAIAAVALASAACGGSSNGGPTTPPGPGGSVTIITLTSTGANPRIVTVDLGTRIRWVNNDNRSHEMASDPHPEHNSCPELNSRLLSPGQQHETDNLVTSRTCGFHDHLRSDDVNLTGTITIR